MKKGQVNKVNRQSITIFNYYIEQLLPSLIKNFTPTINTTHNYSVEHRNITYRYLGDIVHSFSYPNQETILKAASEVYLKDVQSKIDEFSGFREVNCKLKMFPISANVLEQIDLVVLNLSQESQEKSFHTGFLSPRSNQQLRRNLFSSPQREYTSQKEVKKRKQENLQELYVIHRNTESVDHSTLRWINFIERYRFTKVKGEDEEPQNKVIHEIIFSYKSDKALFSLTQSTRLLDNCLEKSCPFGKDQKSLLLQKLILSIDSAIQLEIREVKERREKASFHQSHRRALKMSTHDKETLERLLPRAQNYFKKLNPNRNVNIYFLEQMVCRMMENNSFKEGDSWNAVTYYLDFEKKMREKYTWEDFREFREMNFFTYIGKDKTGKPILLNRVRFTSLSKVKDKEKLFDFHLYLFEIFLQDQMQGWVDQFDVIADASGQTNDNTDIMFTKKLLFELANTTLGRNANIIVFNLGFLTKMFTKIIFPLLPDHFLKIVHLFGQDGLELQEKLTEVMTSDVIPDFMGGTNQNYNEGEIQTDENKRRESVGSRSSELTNGQSLRMRN